MRRVRRTFAWLLLPAVVLAVAGAAVAARLGYSAAQGVGVALIGAGVILAFAMASAGDDAISGYEMRMDGREPQGRRGYRWVEQAWGTGVSDPRSLPHYSPSIDRWLVAGIVYIALGIGVLLVC